MVRGIRCKRSAADLCGRTDGNMKVIFPKEDAAVQPADSGAAPINGGDYVLVEILSANSQSLRGRALGHSRLRGSVMSHGTSRSRRDGHRPSDGLQ